MIVFKKEYLDEIIKYCKKQIPNEACGILAGKDKKVYKVYKMTNIDASPVSYLMEPKEQFKVIKDLRKLSLEMIGIYHSHINAPAKPSQKDIQMAFYSEVSYIIVSFENSNTIVKSFRINNGEVKKEIIKIENE